MTWRNKPPSCEPRSPRSTRRSPRGGSRHLSRDGPYCGVKAGADILGHSVGDREVDDVLNRGQPV